MTVVGVAPVDFVFVWHDIDVYLPAAFTPEERGDDRRHSNNRQMVGQMARGASIDRDSILARVADRPDRRPERVSAARASR